MVPTALVILTASQVLNRSAGLSRGMTSCTLTGPCCLRRSNHSCLIGVKIFGMPVGCHEAGRGQSAGRLRPRVLARQSPHLALDLLGCVRVVLVRGIAVDYETDSPARDRDDRPEK